MAEKEISGAKKEIRDEKKYLAEAEGKLKDITSQHNERKEKNDKMMQEQLHVPDSEWISKGSLGEIVAAPLEKTSVGNKQNSAEDINEMDVVQKASSGLALQGVLLTNNTQDLCETNVIKLPEDIRLDNPSQPYVDRSKRFSSRGKEDEYTKTIKQHGFSVAGSVNAGYAGAGGGAGAGYGQSKRREKTNEYHEEEAYCSLVKHSIVPTASCSFLGKQLQLSDDAVEHLKQLQTKLYGVDIVEECERFLRRFGSHVYTGPLHFGGIYQYKSYTSGFEEKEKSKVQELQEKALTTFANASYNLAAGASASIEVSSLRGEFEGNFRQELLTNTLIDVVYYGGPPHISGLKDWKEEMKSNKKWSLIDRGSKTRPIWEIIKMNHSQDFDDKMSLLVKVLETVWKIINGRVLGCNEVRVVTEQVALWNEIPDESQFETQLDYLVKKKMEVTKDFASGITWPTDFLTQDPLKDYLQSSVEKCLKPEAEECGKSDLWKQYLRQILGPIDLQIAGVFPNQEYITKWLHDQEDLTQIECQNFKRLHEFLEEALEYDQVGSDVKATILVARAVFSLRKHLSTNEELSLLTMLFPFKYLPSEKRFSVLLTKHDLSYLLEHKVDNSIDSQDDDERHFQANLFCVTVKLFIDFGVSKACLQNHIQYLVTRIGEGLNHDVMKCLKELHRRDYSWSAFNERMQSVSLGGSVSDVKEEPDENSGRLHEERGDYIADKNQQTFESEVYSSKLLTRSHALQVRERPASAEEYAEDVADSVDAAILTDGRPDPLWFLQGFITFYHKFQAKGANIDPIESLLTLFHCSDMFLRQDIMRRLASSQIAVPLILPDPHTHKPTFLLGAMESIVVKDVKVALEDLPFSGPLVGLPAPLVTLLGIGHRYSMFNSYFMNKLVSNTNKHVPFPCHRVERGYQRVCASGLIEVTHYIPSEKNAVFPKAVSFAILHGDAREHIEQVQFLSKVSYMLMLLLNETDLDQNVERVLQELCNIGGHTLILLMDPLTGQVNTVAQSLQQYNEVIELSYHDPQTISRLQEVIRNGIDRTEHCYPLSHAVEAALSSGIPIDCGTPLDEKLTPYAKGWKLANEIMTELNRFKESNPNTSPKKLFVLSTELWPKWAAKEREQYQQNSLLDHVTWQRNQMNAIRKEQVTHACNLSPLMQSFINSFSLNHSHEVIWHFLDWLNKFFLLLTKDALPHLHKTYQMRKRDLQDKVDYNRAEEHNTRDALMKLNAEMKNASFRLEHLFREMGQIYEAITSQEDMILRSKFSHYPDIVAQLLIEGFPMELMDGDSADVPLQWVSAIFQKLSEFLNNQKIFVLSVLGLQSTGKSTMLNAMFGVQFSVNIGRCTRGVLMQLLPVHSSLQKKCGFQYFLLIDTEGLGAPDALQVHKRDNEMATFVIGLSDLTIFNIKEGSKGAEDLLNMLQPTLHALVRMKRLKKLRPMCLFVSHSMGAETSGSPTLTAPLNTDVLDGLAQAVAREEGLITDFKFTQIVEYNPEACMYTFCSVWKEDSHNLEYYAEVQKVKNQLLHSSSLIHCNSVVQLNQHIQFLWKTILQEEALFCCRNTLEIATIKKFENQYSEMLRKSEDLMVKWEKETMNNLMECCTPERLPINFTETAESVTQLVQEFESELTESEHDAVLSQWKTQVRESLKHMSKAYHEQAETQFKHLKTCCIAKRRLKSAEDTLQSFANCSFLQLAGTSRALSVGDEQLIDDIFEDNWIKRTTEMIPYFEPMERVKEKIEMDLENGRKSFLVPYRKLMVQRLFDSTVGNKFDQEGPQMTLHVKLTHLTLRSFMEDGSMAEEGALQSARQRTKDVLEKIKLQLQTIQKSDMEVYRCHLISEILATLFQEIQQSPSDNFYFTDEYYVDMVLTVCGFAQGIFEEMSKPFEQLESKKSEMKKKFTGNYRVIIQVEPLAQAFTTKLSDPIKKQCLHLFNTAIVEGMRKSCPWIKNRHTLKMQILLDIGGKLMTAEDTMELIKSLDIENDADSQFITSWIQRYIEDKYEKNLSKLKSETLHELISYIQGRVQAVSNSFERFGNQSSSSEWLIEFCKALEGKLDIEPHDFENGENEQLSNVKIYAHMLTEKLTDLKTQIVNANEWDTSYLWDMEENPATLIFDELTGCSVLCQYCNAQCSNPMKNHDSKHKAFHQLIIVGKPSSFGRGGPRVEHLLNTCSQIAQPEERSLLERAFVYKSSVQLNPAWDFSVNEEDADSDSKYWMWIVGKFTKQVEEVFNKGAQLKNVPPSWIEMKWSDVKKWLQAKIEVTE